MDKFSWKEEIGKPLFAASVELAPYILTLIAIILFILVVW